MTLWPSELHHSKLHCLLLSLGVCLYSRPLSQWCNPTISFSVIPFSFCPQVFPSIRVFSNELALCIRWPQYWSFSFNVNTSNECSGLIPLGLTGLTSLHTKWISRVFSSTTIQKHQFLVLSLLYGPTLTSIHNYWKNHNFD